LGLCSRRPKPDRNHPLKIRTPGEPQGIPASLSSLGHPLAIGSAIVSAAGIVLFFGNWPLFNTLAALGVNVTVLVALVGMGWVPPAA
jgi:hypothetical protein